MNAELRMPPQARDFVIFRAVYVEAASTWRMAEEHVISQTRVRQILKHVSEWLAENLPARTEAQLEQQVRLAQHLAAERLQHLYRETMIRWRASGEAHYLRHITRLALAMGRLGVMPGEIEGLAAEAEEGQEAPNDKQQSSNKSEIRSTKSETSPKAEARGAKPEALADAAGFKSEIGAPALAGHPQSEIPSAPPVGDFSADSGSSVLGNEKVKAGADRRRGGETSWEDFLAGYDPEDRERIAYWINVLKERNTRPLEDRKLPSLEERSGGVTEVRVEPDQPVAVT